MLSSSEEITALQTIIQRIIIALYDLYNEQNIIIHFVQDDKIYFQVYDVKLTPIKTYEVNDLNRFLEIINTKINELLKANPHFENKKYLIDVAFESTLEHFVVPNFVNTEILEKYIIKK